MESDTLIYIALAISLIAIIACAVVYNESVINHKEVSLVEVQNDISNLETDIFNLEEAEVTCTCEIDEDDIDDLDDDVDDAIDCLFEFTEGTKSDLEECLEDNF